MLDSGPGSFLFSASQLASSPSSRHGIPLSSQNSLRFYACEIIQEAGILLHMPQVVTVTAQVLLHRFFCKRSFRDFDARSIAASCVWLSIKLEEAGCWNRGEKRSPLVDVLNVFERIRVRREGKVALPPDCDGFKKQKEELLRLETQILVELGFVCHVEHPHKFLLSYLNCLDATPNLVQEAWNLVNDSLRTSLCVRFPSDVVACGVIYAAARRLGVPLPDSPPWWLLFDVTLEQILEVCDTLADLYRKPKAHYIEVRDCVLSNPSSGARVRETTLGEKRLAESAVSGSERVTSVPSYQEARPSETAIEAPRVEAKSVETADSVSHGTFVQSRQDISRSEEAVKGVEKMSVVSTSASNLINFYVVNAPGAPFSKGMLVGGILMADPKAQLGFQGVRDLVWDRGNERKRDHKDMRHDFSHDLSKGSSIRDHRNVEDIQGEGRRGTEHKRRRKEDEMPFNRRAEDRCKASLSIPHQRGLGISY